MSALYVTEHLKQNGVSRNTNAELMEFCNLRKISISNDLWEFKKGCQTYFFVDASKVQCEYCEKWIHRGTIHRHVRNQHQHTELVYCQYCDSSYKNQASLSNHLRNKHGIYK